MDSGDRAAGGHAAPRGRPRPAWPRIHWAIAPNRSLYACLGDHLEGRTASRINGGEAIEARGLLDVSGRVNRGEGILKWGLTWAKHAFPE